MGNVKVKIRKDGVEELLKSLEVSNECLKHAQLTQHNATMASGEDYQIRKFETNRAGYTVYAATKEAKKDNLKNNTLLSSIE